MRLLKYPLDINDEKVNTLAALGPYIILAGSGGHVMAWKQQQLVDTAFDKAMIKDLKPEISFQVDQDSSGDIFFLTGDLEALCIGSEHRVWTYSDWFNKDTNSINSFERMKKKLMFECKSPSTITDVKYDIHLGIIFVLLSNENKVLLFHHKSSEKLSEIPMDKASKPVTGIIDPTGQTFTILTADRSILVYQVNKTGTHKLINKLTQHVQMYPLHYKISMPPQADILPVINSVKGVPNNATSCTTLLDRNNNYKVTKTLVTPSSNGCKVLVYSPAYYEKPNIKKATSTRYNLIATSGSTDGTVLVWNTKRMKPLFNALQVSSTAINDMSWSQDGLTLFAISNDTTLYTFAFQEKDLGVALPQEEIKTLQESNKKLTKLEEPVPTETPKDFPENVKLEASSSTMSIPNDTSRPISGKKMSKKKLPSGQTNGIKTTQSTSMEFNAPSYTVPKDLKRKPKEATPNDAANNVPTSKKQKKELQPIDFLDTGLMLPNTSFSRIRLATPKIRSTFKYSPINNPNLILEVKNGSGNEQRPTIVKLTSKVLDQDQVLFQDFIPKLVTICTAGDTFWSFCSEDGIIYIYSDSGRKLIAPLILGVGISFLEACGTYLLCLTSIGELYCWNIEQKKLAFPTNTIYPLLNPTLRYSDDILTRAENITLCSITKKGVPLVTLSNGDGYLFDKDMETWLLVSDGWWAYGSQYWDTTNTTGLSSSKANTDAFSSNEANINEMVSDIKNDNQSIINFMERKTNDELNRKSRIKNLQRFARTILMKEGFENMEEIVTLSHLENKILTAIRLEESEEFSKLMTVYCIRLSELGYMDRLDDVFQWLYNDVSVSNTDTRFAEINFRRDLLRKILIACGGIRQVQRVTTRYAKEMNIIS
ncbi:hypothetical protein N7582_002544 [Saccharomyces uvarum]|uniref:Protein HIR n=1 Tax=Saccharomyces uvarum TaxID=230603 RepID=A0AA35JLU5_SACUV|nr:hypothetical protein N7582_002544 [Saccharomyces uvarum]CAI4063958.1 hypothetical protein SUVC_08G0810 [Saccharomyces uvarum]